MIITFIRQEYFLNPLRVTNRDSSQLPRRCTGKSIRSTILNTFAVHNVVLEAHEFGKDLLPWRVETLLSELDQAAMIRDNLEFSMLKITSPLLQGHENCHVFFLVG
jgi:hypothetical protein